VYAGAFVAGLDAGHAYNTFPTMNGRWVPDEYWAVPGWRNAFESTAAVQLHHRALALSTLAAVAALWVGHARAPLPSACRACLHYLLAATGAQVSASRVLTLPGLSMQGECFTVYVTPRAGSVVVRRQVSATTCLESVYTHIIYMCYRIGLSSSIYN